MPPTSLTRTGLHDAAGRAISNLPPSLPEHVRQSLERDIIERRLLPGERITESHLAERVGVSRTPVREAMAALEGQGLIVRLRGRGTHVAPASSHEEAQALFEGRIALESFLAARAAETITPRSLIILRDLQHEFRRELRRELARGNDKVRLARLVSLDSDFHWTIYNASGSGLVSVVASYWGRLLRELYHQVYESEHPSRFADQHDEIISALDEGDPKAAGSAMAEHIHTGLLAITTDFVANWQASRRATRAAR
jgi:DNA-binding GntR family transcriptional regulator